MIDYSADFDDEYDEHLRQQQDRSSLYCMDEAIGDVDEKSQAALTDEQREKINAELSSLRKEKTNFDREVLKWDDQSNEIVVLAKQIAVIMMDMVKFTRGVGPYPTTLDIINAAKRINEIGLKLEKLCRKLASECPESQSKKELISYLNALPLFCNQLSIGCSSTLLVCTFDSLERTCYCTACTAYCGCPTSYCTSGAFGQVQQTFI